MSIRMVLWCREIYEGEKSESTQFVNMGKLEFGPGRIQLLRPSIDIGEAIPVLLLRYCKCITSVIERVRDIWQR